MFTSRNDDSRKLSDLAGRLHFLDIGESERELLKKNQNSLGRIIDESLDKFYERIERSPELSHFFPNHGVVSHAKDRQKQHWESILSADFGSEYVENITRIGNTHARIGLSPKWYIAGYGILLENMIARIVEDYTFRKGRFSGSSKGSSAELGDVIGTVVRVAMLDIDMSVETYLDKLKADREDAQNEGAEALHAIAEALDRMASGDMSVTLDESVIEKAPVISSAFNSLKAGIGGIVSEIREVSASVKDSYRSIRLNSEAAREMATEQMGKISEITKGSASLDKNVTEVLNEMRAATTAIENFSQAVGRGNANVTALQNSIAGISAAWGEMLKLVRDISEISSKINMLALNANIEAARAGEYGKGFTVIAGAIRELAGTTSTAAQKITDLAGSSQDCITDADVSVGETNVILTEIADGVVVVQEVVTAINGVMESQSKGARGNHLAAENLQKSAVQSVEQARKMGDWCDRLVQQSGSLTKLVQEFDNSKGRPG